MKRLISILLINFLFISVIRANEIEQLFLEIKKKPKNALNFFNIGVYYQKNKEYKRALEAYDKVIQLKSKLSPVSLYYKAIIYRDMGKISKAKELMKKIEITSLPEKLKKRVLYFKNELYISDVYDEKSMKSENDDAKKLFVFFELASGKDTNPTYISDSEKQYLDEISSVNTRVKTKLKYLLLTLNNFDLESQYYFLLNSYSSFADLNTMNHNFQIPLSIYTANFRLRFIPGISYEMVNEKKHSRTAKGSFDISGKYNNFLISLMFQHEKIKILNEEYSYYNGSRNIFSITGNFSYDKNTFLISLGYELNDYSDTDTYIVSYSNILTDIAYIFTYKNIDLSLSANFEIKNYKDVSDEYDSRNDFKKTFTVRPDYKLKAYCNLFLELKHVLNDSNYNTVDNDKVYSHTSVLLGTSLFF